MVLRVPVLAFVAAVFVVTESAAAQVIGDSRASSSSDLRAPSARSQSVAAKRRGPSFGGHAASPEVRRMAQWIDASQDNRGLSYMIVDKENAQVFLFNAVSEILGTAPALLGLGRGDDSAAGIGQRRLATMAPIERTTPAGRFEASLGFDLDQDVLWIDYDAALSLHRVIVGNSKDRRHARLASPTPSDNRISYGCINVPPSFYDEVVAPAFKDSVGIVYILPETRNLAEVFHIDRTPSH